jgi:hypothetical protein
MRGRVVIRDLIMFSAGACLGVVVAGVFRASDN